MVEAAETIVLWNAYIINERLNSFSRSFICSVRRLLMFNGLLFLLNGLLRLHHIKLISVYVKFTQV